MENYLTADDIAAWVQALRVYLADIWNHHMPLVAIIFLTGLCLGSFLG
jgi:hypothetical protein